MAVPTPRSHDAAQRATPPGTLNRIRRSLPGAHELRDGSFVHWWIELLLVLAIVLVVVLVVPMFAATKAPPSALGHGEALVSIERTLGWFHEATVQRWALDVTPVVVAANWWYGLMHFAVTAAVFVWLFRRHPDDYPLWRNTLAVASVLALATQALWPATPPRLLDGVDGAPIFVDTLSHYSALWSFRAGGSGGIANQYAAMPSMHCVWALWCTCVVVPRVERRWIKVAAIVYPMITVAAIVVTGNHYVIDAAAGFAALGLGYAAARAFTRTGRHPSTDQASPDQAAPAPASAP